MVDRIALTNTEVVSAEIQQASNGWILTFKKGSMPVLVSVHEKSPDSDTDALDLGKDILEGLDGKLEA